MTRPSYGDAFRFDRVITVYFYTSSAEKLLQARMLFVRSGYELRHFQGRHEPYDEDYSGSSNQLLTKAVRQVAYEFGIRSVFFVEDTSIRINALSELRDYPGLETKEWFAETSFDELDLQIRMRGGNRSATIKSDVALYLPTLTRPLFFHGETHGRVAETPPDFSPSEQYPWLTPVTFNGWFIPDGAARRLGEMEFEESLAYDFRARSMEQLISRIEELNASLNLRPTHYKVRQQNQTDALQLPLIAESTNRRTLLVVGLKCSGKTTLGNYLASKEGVMLYEASSVLRTLAAERDVTISNSSQAHKFLSKIGLEAVGARVVEYLTKSNSPLNVITGLRTIEEVLAIKQVYPEAEVVLIECDARLRYERHIRRARDPDVKTFKQFLAADEDQRSFGIMRVANEIADVVIRNDLGLSALHRRIYELERPSQLAGDLRGKRDSAPPSELHRSLQALAKIGRTATCQEISEATGEGSRRVRQYNTNRALKAAPEFADRFLKPGTRLSYRLTRRGRILLQLLGQIRSVGPEV